MINVQVLSLPFRGCYGKVDLDSDLLFIREDSARLALRNAGVNERGVIALPRVEDLIQLPANKIDWVQIPK